MILHAGHVCTQCSITHVTGSSCTLHEDTAHCSSDIKGCARHGKGVGGEWVGGREREREGEKKSGDWGGCGNCVGIPGRNVFGFCYVRESEEIEGVVKEE